MISEGKNTGLQDVDSELFQLQTNDKITTRVRVIYSTFTISVKIEYL